MNLSIKIALLHQIVRSASNNVESFKKSIPVGTDSIQALNLQSIIYLE